MSDRLIIANRQFANAEPVSDEHKITLVSYWDNSGEQIVGAVVRCLLEGREFFSQSASENLKILLLTFRSYTRSLIADNPLELWVELVQRLDEEIQQSKEFIHPSLSEALDDLLAMASPEKLKEISELRAKQFIEQISGRATLIVSETQFLSWKLNQMLETSPWQFDPDSKVHLDFPNFAKLKLSDFELIAFVGWPNVFRHKVRFGTQLRSLVLGGLAPEVVFVGPQWQAKLTDRTFTRQLLWDLPELIPPQVQIKGPPTEATLIVDLENLEVEEQSRSEVSIASDVTEILDTSNGTALARLIHLPNSLVFPIEDEAQQVSTLAASPNGEAQIKMVNPFSELMTGDVLVANMNGSEQDILRQKVKEKIGREAFDSFTSMTTWWKKSASERLISDRASFISHLEERGCKRIHRLDYWLSEQCIMPQSEEDFLAVLSYLTYESVVIGEVISGAKRFMTEIRGAGLMARKALEESVSHQDLEKLKSGEMVVVEVDGFLGAEYLLAPVVEVGQEMTSVAARQIRQVVELRRGSK